MRQDKFHGRVHNAGRLCNAPGCDQPENSARPACVLRFDGPGDYRWFCLDHVRAFNAGYDFFAGMTPDEIWPRNRRWQVGHAFPRVPYRMRASMPLRAGRTSPIRWRQSRRGRRRAVRITATRRKPRSAVSALKNARLTRCWGWLSMPIAGRYDRAIRNWSGAIIPIATVATAATKDGCSRW
jgi:hypothetical protein